MEPIDYRRAIVRRWPLIVVCALIGAVIGVLVPVHSSSSTPTWQAQALAGVPPSKAANSASTEVTQIEFYAEQEPVFTATLKAMNLKEGAVRLRNSIQLKSVKSKKKKVPPGSLYIQAEGPSKAGAAKLANEFVRQLIAYANQQLAAQHTAAINQTNKTIQTLSGQITSVESQIAALTKKNSPPKKPTTTTTTTTTSTTTTSTTRPSQSHVVPNVAGDAISNACSAIGAQNLVCAPSTEYVFSSSTSIQKSHVITTQPAPGTQVPDGSTVNLVISTGPPPPTTTTTTPGTPQSTLPTTTTTSTGGSSAVVLLSETVARQHIHTAAATTSTTSGGSTTPTTSASGKSQLSLLQTKLKSLTTAYSQATAHLSALQTSTAPQTSFTLLAPARANQSKKVPTSTSLFAHRSVRGGVGAVGGLVLGLALVLLLDAFDKRIKKADRAAVVFGLPVIAEIPKDAGDSPQSRAASRGRQPKKRRKGAPPVFSPGQKPFVALVDEPRSVAAEAYRRLRVSLMFMPPITSNAGHGRTQDSDSVFDGNGFLNDPRDQLQTSQSDKQVDRKVVLVVTPGQEPTGPEVVANLAAAYAEAGQTVLVITNNDLRTPGSAYGPPPAPVVPPMTTTTQPWSPSEAGAPTEQLSAVGPLSPGEATAPVPVIQSEPAGRLANGRAPITAEEVVAHCKPQQIPGVSRLQLGEMLRGPGEMATKGNDLITTARQVADVVLVEMPALLAWPDAEAIVRSSDALIVVAECYLTTVGQAARSAQLLGRIGAPTLGVVVTGVDMSRKDLKKASSSAPPADLRNAPAYAMQARS